MPNWPKTTDCLISGNLNEGHWTHVNDTKAILKEAALTHRPPMRYSNWAIATVGSTMTKTAVNELGFIKVFQT